MNKILGRVLDLGCLALLSSVVMDSYLWIARCYLIPCWTMAVMSAGLITLLQVLKRQINTPTDSTSRKGL